MDKRNDTDILRAEDIIPPFNRKKEPPQKQSANDETPAQKANEIPKFDLAKQIMAEKRKNSSTKRKAPKAAAQKPQTANKRFQISPEYNGVQNVIERAYLSHQKKQSTLQKPKDEIQSPIPNPQHSPKASKGTIQYTQYDIPTTHLRHPKGQYGQKIISEIVARDIKKLISGNISM